tara:strand:+ start:57 stop:1148 length:1092 start_codon:yes stop_codon:yes gene_type:complete
MNICLIGNNLTNLVLAKNLLDRKINIDLFCHPTINSTKTTRTIGISENNIDFFNINNINLSKISWPIKNIKVFNEIDQKIEILNFKSSNKFHFSMVKYEELFKSLNDLLKNKKNFKKYKIKKNLLNKIIFSPKYNLIINSDKKNNIMYNYFFGTINKDYRSTAHTTLMKHDYCNNNTAVQIFTKIGPIAFLPLSNTRTSVVFSVIDQSIKLKDIKIEEYITKYNSIYKINSFSEIEKFKLKFSFPRNYYHNNILLFGDLLHQIHPLAGQGFNMTLRDVKILLNIIDEHQSLGLPLDKNLLMKFENEIKHLNFIFASGIDFIHEFFKFDNKLNNLVTRNIFKVLSDNKIFNNYVSKFANKGIGF